MSENFNELKEYLLYIRQKENQKLEFLKERGELGTYIFNLHQKMLIKYPEMIDKIITENGIENGPGGMTNE